jgi:hypothetical protein
MDTNDYFNVKCKHMIQNPTSRPVASIGNPKVVQLQGSGRIALTAQKDVFRLITENEQYTIIAPGHTFTDGDEVNFELTDGTVFLIRKVSSSEGQLVAQTFRDELVLQPTPDTKILIKALESVLQEIESQTGDHSKIFSAALLRQLTDRIKEQITSEQLEQLQQIVELLNENDGSRDLKKIEVSIRNLITQLNTATVQFKTPASLLSVCPGLITFPDQNIVDGIYQFQDKDSMLQFLGNKEELSNLQGFLSKVIESEGLLSLRIADAGTASAGAFIVTSQALEDQMRSLICSVTPDILQKIPVEIFLKFCSVNGGIDKNFISLLAGAIKNTGNNFVNTLGDEGSEALLQWLHLFNQNRDMAAIFTLRQPGMKGTDLLRGVLGVMEKYNVMPGLNLNGLGIVPGAGKDAFTQIESSLQRMGITTESRLAQGVMPAGSVKAELYRILASQSGDGGAVSADTNANFKGISSVNTPSDIMQGVRSFQGMLRQEMAYIRNVPQPQEQALVSMLSKAVDSIEMLPRSSGDSQSVQLSVTVPKDLRERLSILLTALETVIQPKDTMTGVVPQKLTTISSILDLLGQVSRTLPGLEAFRVQIDEIKAGLQSLLTATETGQLRSKVSENNGADLLHKNAETGLQTDGLIRSVLGNNGDISFSPPQKMVEQLINRIESIQLLARQVNVQDGTSQILELPVKIGNEWTDVTLHFMKKRTLKKGSDTQKHFTVQLDTAPSRLGQIHAILDYEKGKNLSITMEFENKDVTAWFVRNQEQIRRSLQEHQIHFVNLHFKTPADAAAQKKSSALLQQNSGVDIRI